MNMVKVFLRSEESLPLLAKQARRRRWSDRELTKQGLYIHLSKAFTWMLEHGCLRKKS